LALVILIKKSQFIAVLVDQWSNSPRDDCKYFGSAYFTKRIWSNVSNPSAVHCITWFLCRLLTSLISHSVVMAVRVSVPRRWSRSQRCRGRVSHHKCGSRCAASRISTSPSRRIDSIFSSVTDSMSVASSIVLSLSMLIVNRTPILAFMGRPSWVDTRGVPFLRGVSYY